jgi:glycosyltransferase involved in cell wall biosynthesis
MSAAPLISDGGGIHPPAAGRTSIRVAEIITGLNRGGAEIMLLRLLAAMDRQHVDPVVISLLPPGPLAVPIAALGIPVHSVHLGGGLKGFAGFGRLWSLLRRLRPDLVHTWMYHADLIGGTLARLATAAPVIWALHNSSLDPAQTRFATRLTARFNALLSYLVPARIVSCSRVAMAIHRRLGYAAGRFALIPNGFDIDAFRPDPDQRAAVRAELGIPAAAPLVGAFGRFHPQKDHRNLCRAAARVATRRPDVHWLLAGADITPANARLAGWISETDVPERFHLLGERDDMPRLTAALDLLVVASSFGEAFPLVIGEAMACAVPAVATDVGDVGLMIGDTGRVVPPRDPAALAAAVLGLLDLDADALAALGAAARARISAEFALPAVAARYEALYDEVLAGRGRG